MKKILFVLVILVIAVPSQAQISRWFHRSVAHKLTVINGTGGGNFKSGQKVTIKANVPAGYQMAAWFLTDLKTTKQWPKAPVSDVNGVTTILTMPNNDLIISATFVR